MKYFLLKRKEDGKFICNNGMYVEISDNNNNIGLATFYTEKDALEWGRIWKSVFEFIPVNQNKKTYRWQFV